MGSLGFAFVLGAATAFMVGGLAMAAGSRSGQVTTRGRRKVRGERAFVLAVQLQIAEESTARLLIADWRQAADYCLVNEPFLFHYEFAQSDKDPLRYLVYERYRCKSDYLGAHKQSSAFAEFRPKLKLLQDSGAVTVSGDSWDGLGVGFV